MNVNKAYFLYMLVFLKHSGLFDVQKYFGLYFSP